MKTPFLLALLAMSSNAAIKTETASFKHGGKTFEGYFAWDDSLSGKRPGILVVHEWFGHGPYVRRRAEELAKLGYVAFAGDMYGKGVYAKTHEEAAKLAGAVRGDRKLMRARGQANLDALKKHPAVDGSKLAALGYCFGGTTVLELARAGAAVLGVVSFHGSLGTPMPAEKIAAKVLALHGAEDKHVNPEVPAFEDEMRKAGADWQLVKYGGAAHSFTVPEAGDDPSKGMAYDEKADKRSWEAMRAFLSEVFRR